MIFTKTEIDGVIIIRPKVIKDDRGYFMEEFRQNVFDQEGGHIEFDTEYELEAKQGSDFNPLSGCGDASVAFAKQTIRQQDFSTRDSASPAMLLRCVIGNAIVTVSDERKDSHTFGQQLSIELSDSNNHFCFIPRGVSFSSLSVLSPKALLQFRCSQESGR